MAKRRSAQLDQEIREALAKISKKPSLETREQLDAEIDAILARGLPAERHEVARALGFAYPKRPPPKKTTVTELNVYALAQIVLQNRGRSTFSNRLPRVDYPHVRRTLGAGLVTVSSPTTLTLSPEGRSAVLRLLRKDHDSLVDAMRRFPDRFPEGDRQLALRREAIENLEAGA
jgi:hypothetical protein